MLWILSLFSNKNILIIFALILFTCIGIFAYRYISLVHENEELLKNLEESKAQLAVTQQRLLDTEKANEDLFNTMNKYRLSSQKSTDKLNKLEKSITKIYSKHPKLLNKTINEAQKKVNKCFEDISKGMESDICLE